MKYKFWIIGIIIMTLCTMLHPGHMREGQEAKAWGDIHGQDIMDNLFKRAGCRWIKTDISAWAAVDLGDISDEDLVGILVNVGNCLIWILTRRSSYVIMKTGRIIYRKWQKWAEI